MEVDAFIDTFRRWLSQYVRSGRVLGGAEYKEDVLVGGVERW